jgi:DinB superfamily
MNVQHSIAALLQRDLAGFEREIGLFPDDETLWRTMPGVPNSAGNLALHVAGNLQHFVGAVLGGSAYVRDRDGEFSRRSGSQREIVEELQKARVAVRTVVPNLSDGILQLDFPEVVIPNRRIQTLRFLLHLCAHASFHLGQAGYLRRGLTGQSQSAGPVPLSVLTDPQADR